jgi:hypothetical protein
VREPRGVYRLARGGTRVSPLFEAAHRLTSELS